MPAMRAGKVTTKISWFKKLKLVLPNFGRTKSVLYHQKQTWYEFHPYLADTHIVSIRSTGIPVDL